MRTRIATLLAILGLAACVSEDPGCGAFDVSFVTEDSAQQPATTFTIGEPVGLRVSVSNVAFVPRELSPQTCPQFTLRIDIPLAGIGGVGGEVPVWFYGDGTVNAPLMSCAGSITLAPGETVSQPVIWDQRALGSNLFADGEQVPRGSYIAHAFDSTTCSARLDATTVFEIVQ